MSETQSTPTGFDAGQEHGGQARLTEDPYLCPPCYANNCAEHKDLFNMPFFGLKSCDCQTCEPT